MACPADDVASTTIPETDADELKPVPPEADKFEITFPDISEIPSSINIPLTFDEFDEEVLCIEFNTLPPIKLFWHVAIFDAELSTVIALKLVEPVDVFETRIPPIELSLQTKLPSP